MFNSMTSSNMIYMITGARGTGKTVMLSELINSFLEDKDWVTIDLDPLQDLVSQLDYQLKSGNIRSKNTEVTINTPEIIAKLAGREKSNIFNYGIEDNYRDIKCYSY